MLLLAVLPMPYIIRSLLVAGGGAALAVLLELWDIPLKTFGDTGGAIILSSLLLPIGLTQRGHYTSSVLARIIVVLGIAVTLFNYFGLNQLVEGMKQMPALSIKDMLMADTLAEKMSAIGWILPLLVCFFGALAFLGSGSSGFCGMWATLFLVGIWWSKFSMFLFGTSPDDWKKAILPVGATMILLSLLLTISFGTGHFLGELGKLISPDKKPAKPGLPMQPPKRA
jgi:hypothetical protein